MSDDVCYPSPETEPEAFFKWVEETKKAVLMGQSRTPDRPIANRDMAEEEVHG